MKRLFYLFCIVVLLSSNSLFSNLYIGLGGNYSLPLEPFSNYDEKAVGFNFNIESRQFCKLWYGFRLNHTSFEAKEGIIEHYESITELTPHIKYAPFTDKCYDNKFIPYLYGQFSVSSITSTDLLPKLSLGAGIGLGVAYNFKCLNRCWTIEINSLYSAPNTISTEKIENLKLINSAITLSVGL